MLFAGEFICIFAGLTLTSASRMAVFLYTAPCFTALGLHAFVPGETMRRAQWCGVAVAFAGIISFVGLIIPHLMRMIVGPGHRGLVPASALGGAVLLVLADLFARSAVPYADLPIGMLTSLVGGPVFFWLLRRARRSAGGWA